MFEKIIGQKSGDTSSNPSSRQENAPQRPAAPPSASPAHTPRENAAPASSSSPAPASRPSGGSSRNVLSSDVEIKGTVKFTNDLVVDGRIEGEIASEGSLTVGENARLRAEINTPSVVVYGKVHGNITAAERVELKSSAEVVGDIKTKSLSMEPGAIFVGKSTVGTPSSIGAAAAKGAPAPAAAKTGGQTQQELSGTGVKA